MTEKKIIRVSDVMSREVVKVERSATVHDAVRLMSEHRTSSVIVERRDEDDEFGLVAVADIALGEDMEHLDGLIPQRPLLLVIHELPRGQSGAYVQI